MKVWFPCIRTNSGTDIYTRRLANALRSRNVETEITWFSPRYEFLPHLLYRFPVPPGTDVIHANTWNGFAFGRHGRPLIVTEHLGVNDPENRRSPNPARRIYHQLFIKTFIRKSLNSASIVTAVSEFVGKGLKRAFDADARAVYNWVDTSVFKPANPGNEPKHPFRLLFIGNLSMRKGADLLPSVMEKLGNAFELAFTSGLRDGGSIRVTDNMKSIGRLTSDDELVAAYNSCDAVIYPSRSEGFGLVPAEAMACGKPVVAFNNTALPEVIKDGETGILCPTDDVESLVAACRRLASNSDIYRTYSIAARRRVEELFCEEAIIPRYMSLYEEAIERFKRAPNQRER